LAPQSGVVIFISKKPALRSNDSRRRTIIGREADMTDSDVPALFFILRVLWPN